MSRISPASYSIYAPLRYEITRPFIEKFCARAKSVTFLHGAPKTEAVFHHELWATMAKKVPIRLDTQAIALNETYALRAYYHFHQNGKIIYNFQKELTSALNLTDAGSIKLSSIEFPSDAFYIHFGKIEWPEGLDVDIEGVYVYKDHLYNDGSCLALLPVKSGKFIAPFQIELDNKHGNDPVLVDLKGEYNDIEGFLKSEQTSFNEVLENPGNLPCWDEFTKFTGISAVNPLKHSLLLRVVINCLLYIKAAPDDSEEDWEDRAPRELVQRATTAEKKGTRISAEKTLNNQDYLKIKFIGRKFSATCANYSKATPSHGKKSTHIRRGHFKNQAYGPQWSEHRPIFIPPIIVNADSGDIPGIIYDI